MKKGKRDSRKRAADIVVTQQEPIDFHAGMKISVEESEYVKIMAIVDGYVMARMKGAYPFIMPMKKFRERFKIKSI